MSLGRGERLVGRLVGRLAVVEDSVDAEDVCVITNSGGSQSGRGVMLFEMNTRTEQASRSHISDWTLPYTVPGGQNGTRRPLA